MNHVMDMMEDRKTWYSSGTQTMKELHAEGKLTQEIVSFMINNMRKNNLNVFEGYVREPIFDTGAIVQFRSNIGVDAILQENNCLDSLRCRCVLVVSSLHCFAKHSASR